MAVEEEFDDDNDDKGPLIWKCQQIPISNKGKGKFFGEGLSVRRTYSTHSMEKKVLCYSVKAIRKKHIAKKKQNSAMVVEEEISEDKLVDVDIDWTELEDEENHVNQGPSQTKLAASEGK